MRRRIHTEKTMSFERMTNIVAPAVAGLAKIDHYTPSRFEVMMAGIRGQAASEETVVRLFVDGGLMMSDGADEKRSNAGVVYAANGDVMIAGLGIGLILVPILKKPTVKSVTVIEKYQDVIDLVAPSFPYRILTVICADINDWKPDKGTKYDTIYFDIWPDVCTDNLEEINTLHRRFKNYKRAGGWMNSWQRERLVYLKRRGQ